MKKRAGFDCDVCFGRFPSSALHYSSVISASRAKPKKQILCRACFLHRSAALSMNSQAVRQLVNQISHSQSNPKHDIHLLHLPSRVEGALFKGNVLTIKELCRHSAEGLLQYRGIGPGSIYHIISSLNKINKKLHPSYPKDETLERCPKETFNRYIKKFFNIRWIRDNVNSNSLTIDSLHSILQEEWNLVLIESVMKS